MMLGFLRISHTEVVESMGLDPQRGGRSEFLNPFVEVGPWKLDSKHSTFGRGLVVTAVGSILKAGIGGESDCWHQKNPQQSYLPVSPAAVEVKVDGAGIRPGSVKRWALCGGNVAPKMAAAEHWSSKPKARGLQPSSPLLPFSSPAF